MGKTKIDILNSVIKINDTIKESNNYINYVVKKGDTLSVIACKYNITYKHILDFNNINDFTLIYPNQIIKIPNNRITPTTYIVKKEDTLYEIAKKYNLSWQNLYKKNKNVIGDNPHIIKPGQILTI